ncbi:N-acetylmuramoyl-L-alanine amidase [Bacteroidia bacterium]|nr:N-acetylmuramoyl-L-alanine amidase [Bacteroidia bacterium]
MKRCFALIICLFAGLSGAAQGKRSADYEAYIRQYSPLAVAHMQKYKIPASITLAQGLLESGAGRGRLAREGNNHFGIKCHEWEGKKMYQKDDGPNDCFRVYNKADDSFEDHARFLSERTRYAVLFTLNPRDYQAWARGLKKCGYATDPNYPTKLIKLIEDYELYRFDTKQSARKAKPNIVVTVNPKKQPGQYLHQPYKDHGLVYVIALEDDSYEKIARDLGFRIRDLVKWNEVPHADFPLFKGDIVWLQKKNKKAELPFSEHRVREGESMHKISQWYGIHVKQLYKLNHKTGDYVPQVDDVLQLR